MPIAMSAQTLQQRTRHSSHRKVRCMVQGSGSRPTPFELGQIKVHAESGLGPTAIAELVHKEDGSKVSKEGERRGGRDGRGGDPGLVGTRWKRVPPFLFKSD